MSYIPLDIVHYMFGFMGRSSIETMICKGLKDRYDRDIPVYLRRINVLRYTYDKKDITDDIKRYCLGEYDFFHGRYCTKKLDHKSQSICYNLGLLARESDNKSSFALQDFMSRTISETKIIEEAEGIVRCLNICPDLIMRLKSKILQNLPIIQLIKPSKDVIDYWRYKRIPKLFLDNPDALDRLILWNREKNYIDTSIKYDIKTLINLVVKTKYAVEIFLCNECFEKEWQYIYEILSRESLLAGLESYSRLIITSLGYGRNGESELESKATIKTWKYGYTYGIESLYKLSIRRNDKEVINLIHNIFRIKIQRYEYSGPLRESEEPDLTYKLLICFNEQEPELSDTYYLQYWGKVNMNDPWTLKEWLQIETKYYNRIQTLLDIDNERGALLEPGEDIDGYVIVENEDYILLLS